MQSIVANAKSECFELRPPSTFHSICHVIFHRWQAFALQRCTAGKDIRAMQLCIFSSPNNMQKKIKRNFNMPNLKEIAWYTIKRRDRCYRKRFAHNFITIICIYYHAWQKKECNILAIWLGYLFWTCVRSDNVMWDGFSSDKQPYDYLGLKVIRSRF